MNIIEIFIWEFLTKTFFISTEAVKKCDNSEEAPVVVYVSKVFSSPFAQSDNTDTGPKIFTPKIKNEQGDQQGDSSAEIVPSEKKNFIGFARIFSGVLKRGQKVHVLGPRYDPLLPEKHSQIFEVQV
jgi:ribosome assembly protein 1